MFAYPPPDIEVLLRSILTGTSQFIMKKLCIVSYFNGTFEVLSLIIIRYFIS